MRRKNKGEELRLGASLAATGKEMVDRSERERL